MTTEVLNVDNGLYCGESGRRPSSETRFGCLSRKIEPNRQHRVSTLIFFNHLDESKVKQLAPRVPAREYDNVRARGLVWLLCTAPATLVGPVSTDRSRLDGVCIHVKNQGKGRKHMRRSIETIWGCYSIRE